MFVILYLGRRDSDDAVEVTSSPSTSLQTTIGIAKNRLAPMAGAAESAGMVGFVVENESGEEVFRWYRSFGEEGGFR